MHFQPVDKRYVLADIDQLKNGQEYGPDKVNMNLVKDAKEYLVHALMLIYNSPLKNGVVPDIWKLAKFTPIYKSNPKTDLNNYMPIFVISVLSKLL